MISETKLEKLAYSPRECAYVLGVCESKIRQMIRDGRLAHYREGRRVLVRKVDVEKYQADQVAAAMGVNG